MKNIKWDRIIIIVAIFCFYQFSVIPLIEKYQTIFPMKEHEIETVSVWIEDHLYSNMNQEQINDFVDAMNQIVLLVGDGAKDTLAHSILDDWKVNRYEHPCIADVRIVYKQTLLQKKTGLDICFYEDNSFFLQEWSRIKVFPFTDTIVSKKPYVYEPGCEAFTDGSENQEAVKTVLKLLDDQKIWFAEH